MSVKHITTVGRCCSPTANAGLIVYIQGFGHSLHFIEQCVMTGEHPEQKSRQIEANFMLSVSCEPVQSEKLDLLSFKSNSSGKCRVFFPRRRHRSSPSWGKKTKKLQFQGKTFCQNNIENSQEIRL